MQHLLIIVISIHVLAGVFWAGSSFALARNGGLGAERLFAPQMGAALIAVLSGAYLWKSLHAGSFGPAERSLGLGVAAAISAFAVQVAFTGPALRTLQRVTEGSAARRRLLVANRVAAALLAGATIGMAAARYA